MKNDISRALQEPTIVNPRIQVSRCLVNVKISSTNNHLVSDPYDILGVERSATSVEIKKAYRKLALSHHPDKVPEDQREESEVKFKEISAAYEILIDDDKRANFDQYGDANGPSASGFGGGGSYGYDDVPGFGPEDFFSFFNGGHPGMNGGGAANARRRATTTEDAHLDINVTLGDLYNGKTVKITSTRNILCTLCKGEGVKANAKTKQCGICKGEGYVRKIRRVGPGMVTQDYVDCSTCKGKGVIHRSKDKCKKCDGKTTEEETKILEFVIEKGSNFGDSITLKNESDEEYGKEAGDVILTIHEKATNEIFERVHDDLYADLNISLAESLCGFKDKIILKHLDDRLLKISTPTGKVLRPNDFLKISGEGFPIKNSNRKGDLYLKVIVEFPPDNWFSEKAEIQKVLNILPGSRQKEIDEDVSINNVDDVDFKVMKYDELPEYTEEEEEQGYQDQGPGCTQQ